MKKFKALVLALMFMSMFTMGVTANEGRAELCPESGKVEVNGPAEIVVTAKEGQLISGYCVKAGHTINTRTFDPPVDSVTIYHDSGKDISHYTVFYVDVAAPPTEVPPTVIPTPTSEPSPPVTETPTETPVVIETPTVPPTEAPVETPVTVTPDVPVETPTPTVVVETPEVPDVTPTSTPVVVVVETPTVPPLEVPAQSQEPVVVTGLPDTGTGEASTRDTVIGFALLGVSGFIIGFAIGFLTRKL